MLHLLAIHAQRRADTAAAEEAAAGRPALLVGQSAEERLGGSETAVR